jgi:hypothetical protein
MYSEKRNIEFNSSIMQKSEVLLALSLDSHTSPTNLHLNAPLLSEPVYGVDRLESVQAD